MSRLLAEVSTRMVSIIGRGGMGKSALAAIVLSRLEQNRWSHTDQRIAVDGIVYLSTRTSEISLERLILDGATTLGGAKAAALNTVWANPELTPEQKVVHFLESLSSGLYIILLDNLEDLLDENGSLTDPELQIFVDKALQMMSGPRLLVTSRIALALRLEVSRFDQRVVIDILAEIA